MICKHYYRVESTVPKAGAIINRTGSETVYDCATTTPVFFIALCLSRESKQKVQPGMAQS